MSKQIEILQKKLLSEKNEKTKYALANKIKKLREKEKKENWEKYLAQ
jgi:hypothetical protein